MSVKLAQDVAKHCFDEFWRLSDHHRVFFDGDVGLSPALVYNNPVEILLKHPLHRVAGGPLNRTESGVQGIAVLFLEVVNDEVRVGNSLLAVNDVRQLAFGAAANDSIENGRSL